MDYALYHAAEAADAATLLAQGLQYGTTGPGNKENHAQQTNAFLDKQRPGWATEAHLSRSDCLYAYLALGGQLLDVDSGRTVVAGQWHPGDGQAAFRLAVRPSIAWISDLDCYDALAKAIQDRAPAATRTMLAHNYWSQLVRIDTLLQHYELRGSSLHKKETAPGHMPRRFDRAEVLLTASIPPQNIARVS